MYQGSVESVEHRHACNKPLPQISEIVRVKFETIKCPFAFCVEPIVVQQEPVKLFENLETGLICINELLLLVIRYLFEFILYIAQEIGKTACLDSQNFVLSRAVAACGEISVQEAVGVQMTNNSCIPFLLVRTP